MKYSPKMLVGTGGNINKIHDLCGLRNWKPLAKHVHKEKLEFLSRFTPEELQVEFDIKPDRADVIVHGGSIYYRGMKEANIEKMIVPKVGLADGLIRRMYFEDLNKSE
ncbi:MAG: hypothetical protein GY816_06975 [Cytophagales bacterium]|nr:hypothetical protein [Cytophagales bacterium]